VENVLIAKINWGGAKVEKYRAKYHQEKQHSKDAKEWFDREIKNKERELKKKKEAADNEIKRLKKNAKKEMDTLTKQMVDSLSLSEVERAASDKNPSELAALLAQRYQAAEKRVSELQRQQRDNEHEIDALKQCYQDEKKNGRKRNDICT
jgi:chaperonin cofactor prefoldin